MAKFEIQKFEGDISKLAPIVAKWEGGYVNDPVDKGGATNMGITLETWKHLGYDKNNDGIINAADVKLLNKNDFQVVLRKYWDKWHGDDIKNQSIADILADWFWGSGAWGIVLPQRLLGLKEDGVVGPKTLAAINAQDPKELHAKLFAARVNFLNKIVSNSIIRYEKQLGRKATAAEIMANTQKKFIAGWLNRLNDFKYKA